MLLARSMDSGSALVRSFRAAYPSEPYAIPPSALPARSTRLVGSSPRRSASVNAATIRHAAYPKRPAVMTTRASLPRGLSPIARRAPPLSLISPPVPPPRPSSRGSRRQRGRYPWRRNQACPAGRADGRPDRSVRFPVPLRMQVSWRWVGACPGECNHHSRIGPRLDTGALSLQLPSMSRSARWKRQRPRCATRD